MASRLDAIQTVVNRSPETAAQTHAAQRQPVVAQEHATAANRQEAAAKQERPEALARREGREVKNDLVTAATERDSRRRTPRRRAAPSASGSDSSAPDETLDGKGNLLDLRA